MSFDDRAADRKSHAHAARFGRVEWIEQAVETLRFKSGAESRISTWTQKHTASSDYLR
jgi:hypothetical protein